MSRLPHHRLFANSLRPNDEIATDRSSEVARSSFCESISLMSGLPNSERIQRIIQERRQLAAASSPDEMRAASEFESMLWGIIPPEQLVRIEVTSSAESAPN